MYNNYFIVGINTPKRSYTYHYHIQYWCYFDVKELPNAPEWDGHTENDCFERMFSLLDFLERDNEIGKPTATITLKEDK